MDKASVLTLSGGEIIKADTFSVTGNSTVSVVPEQTLYLKIPEIIVNSGSTISADGKGFIIPAEGRRGGGVIHLIADNNLQNDGIISANGN